MTTPVAIPTFPSLYPYQLAMMSSMRAGKTMVLEHAMREAARSAGQAAEAMRKFKPVLIAHDEFWRFTATGMEPLPPRDRSLFEREGRYRKPPVTVNAKPPEPGMVQVRNRAGELVWKKLGKGMKAAQ